MASFEDAEATEGRERRPRPPEGSLLSAVDSVEVLAEEECLLPSKGGVSTPVVSVSIDPHAISSLKGGSMVKIDLYVGV